MDLNTVGEEVLTELTLLASDQARQLIEARPFTSWADVEKLPGFTTECIEGLKKAGAKIVAPNVGIQEHPIL